MRKFLTKDQIKHLLDTYEKEGGASARILAVGYDISPEYLRKLAFRHGVKAKVNKKPRRMPAHLDPRWARARAIGDVVI